MVRNSWNRSRCKTGYAVVPLVSCLLLSACSALPKGELSLDLGIKDRGVASWYGKEFHGKLAANGEVFDMTAYTAAHRKLPLGSLVRVVNLTNGKSVQVRINDRGPYVTGRMLDLSQAAARELGMLEAGTSAVQIEVIGNHRPVTPMPSSMVPSVAGMLLNTDTRLVTRHRPQEEGVAIPAVPLRMMPQEALYVRRERRIGSMLAADHSAHNTVPVLIVS
ncbi:MAG: septal ring lytic transglycosylase RlpA family protein [Nitrospira sp.]|jgi:rare lipoprotein A|nr:septal ring lytic transglycosylase RlpA family protein [Nitrospira sp. CR1.1]MBX3343280.1 septal ring lytic transglycosylase RlpA family protein [Nitrospira sp.]